MKRGNKKEEIRFCIGVVFVLAMLFLAKDANKVLEAGTFAKGEETSPVWKEGEEMPCVVIDPGHGGWDPGKIGIEGQIEKDINLEIAKKLKAYLEASDVSVVMTRATDEGLYDADATNKKAQDMKRRIEIIEKCQPLVVISIHQNSYTSEKVSGFQVFYREGNVYGKKMAQLVQDSVMERTKQQKERPIKSNDSYYLLTKTQLPVVIAECGFLSNLAEAQRLSEEEYRDRMAYSLHMAVMQFLNMENRGK